MRVGRVVIFGDSPLQIGQVTSINPQGGADIKTAPDATPVFVERFHKLRPFSLVDAVQKFGATLSNAGLSFPSGLNVSLEDLGSHLNVTESATKFIGVPLGEESVVNPHAPLDEFGSADDEFIEDESIEDEDEEEYV